MSLADAPRAEWPKSVAEYAAFSRKSTRWVNKCIAAGHLGRDKKRGLLTVITEEQHQAFAARKAAPRSGRKSREALLSR